MPGMRRPLSHSAPSVFQNPRIPGLSPKGSYRERTAPTQSLLVHVLGTAEGDLMSHPGPEPATTSTGLELSRSRCIHELLVRRVHATPRHEGETHEAICRCCVTGS